MAKRNEAEAFVASFSVARRMAKAGILTPEELERAKVSLCEKHGIKKDSALIQIMLIQSP